MKDFETPRGRRIRDRERLAARAERISARWAAKPDDAHRERIVEEDDGGGRGRAGRGELVRPDWEWRDLDGVTRHGHQDWSDVLAARKRFARLYRDHLAHCRKACCANPRRFGGTDRLTRQEIQAIRVERESLREFSDDDEEVITG